MSRLLRCATSTDDAADAADAVRAARTRFSALTKPAPAVPAREKFAEGRALLRDCAARTIDGAGPAQQAQAPDRAHLRLAQTVSLAGLVPVLREIGARRPERDLVAAASTPWRAHVHAVVLSAPTASAAGARVLAAALSTLAAAVADVRSYALEPGAEPRPRPALRRGCGGDAPLWLAGAGPVTLPGGFDDVGTGSLHAALSARLEADVAATDDRGAGATREASAYDFAPDGDAHVAPSTARAVCAILAVIACDDNASLVADCGGRDSRDGDAAVGAASLGAHHGALPPVPLDDATNMFDDIVPPPVPRHGSRIVGNASLLPWHDAHVPGNRVLPQIALRSLAEPAAAGSPHGGGEGSASSRPPPLSTLLPRTSQRVHDVVADALVGRALVTANTTVLPDASAERGGGSVTAAPHDAPALAVASAPAAAAAAAAASARIAVGKRAVRRVATSSPPLSARGSSAAATSGAGASTAAAAAAAADAASERAAQAVLCASSLGRRDDRIALCEQFPGVACGDDDEVGNTDAAAWWATPAPVRGHAGIAGGDAGSSAIRGGAARVSTAPLLRRSLGVELLDGFLDESVGVVGLGAEAPATSASDAMEFEPPALAPRGNAAPALCTPCGGIPFPPSLQLFGIAGLPLLALGARGVHSSTTAAPSPHGLRQALRKYPVALRWSGMLQLSSALVPTSCARRLLATATATGTPLGDALDVTALPWPPLTCRAASGAASIVRSAGSVATVARDGWVAGNAGAPLSLLLRFKLKPRGLGGVGSSDGGRGAALQLRGDAVNDAVALLCVDARGSDFAERCAAEAAFLRHCIDVVARGAAATALLSSVATEITTGGGGGLPGAAIPVSSEMFVAGATSTGGAAEAGVDDGVTQFHDDSGGTEGGGGAHATTATGAGAADAFGSEPADGAWHAVPACAVATNALPPTSVSAPAQVAGVLAKRKRDAVSGGAGIVEGASPAVAAPASSSAAPAVATIEATVAAATSTSRVNGGWRVLAARLAAGDEATLEVAGVLDRSTRPVAPGHPAPHASDDGEAGSCGGESNSSEDGWCTTARGRGRGRRGRAGAGASRRAPAMRGRARARGDSSDAAARPASSSLPAVMSLATAMNVGAITCYPIVVLKAAVDALVQAALVAADDGQSSVASDLATSAPGSPGSSASSSPPPPPSSPLLSAAIMLHSIAWIDAKTDDSARAEYVRRLLANDRYAVSLGDRVADLRALLEALTPPAPTGSTAVAGSRHGRQSTADAAGTGGHDSTVDHEGGGVLQPPQHNAPVSSAAASVVDLVSDGSGDDEAAARDGLSHGSGGGGPPRAKRSRLGEAATASTDVRHLAASCSGVADDVDNDDDVVVIIDSPSNSVPRSGNSGNGITGAPRGHQHIPAPRGASFSHAHPHAHPHVGNIEETLDGGGGSWKALAVDEGAWAPQVPPAPQSPQSAASRRSEQSTANAALESQWQGPTVQLSRSDPSQWNDGAGAGTGAFDPAPWNRVGGGNGGEQYAQPQAHLRAQPRKEALGGPWADVAFHAASAAVTGTVRFPPDARLRVVVSDRLLPDTSLLRALDGPSAPRPRFTLLERASIPSPVDLVLDERTAVCFVTLDAAFSMPPAGADGAAPVARAIVAVGGRAEAGGTILRNIADTKVFVRALLALAPRFASVYVVVRLPAAAGAGAPRVGGGSALPAGAAGARSIAGGGSAAMQQHQSTAPLPSGLLQALSEAAIIPTLNFPFPVHWRFASTPTQAAAVVRAVTVRRVEAWGAAPDYCDRRDWLLAADDADDGNEDDAAARAGGLPPRPPTLAARVGLSTRDWVALEGLLATLPSLHALSAARVLAAFAGPAVEYRDDTAVATAVKGGWPPDAARRAVAAAPAAAANPVHAFITAPLHDMQTRLSAFLGDAALAAAHSLLHANHGALSPRALAAAGDHGGGDGGGSTGGPPNRRDNRGQTAM